jgi:hypothetical protein
MGVVHSRRFSNTDQRSVAQAQRPAKLEISQRSFPRLESRAWIATFPPPLCSPRSARNRKTEPRRKVGGCQRDIQEPATSARAVREPEESRAGRKGARYRARESHYPKLQRTACARYILTGWRFEKRSPSGGIWGSGGAGGRPVRARCFLAALVETSFPPACARNGIPSKGGERERERDSVVLAVRSQLVSEPLPKTELGITSR